MHVFGHIGKTSVAQEMRRQCWGTCERFTFISQCRRQSPPGADFMGVSRAKLIAPLTQMLSDNPGGMEFKQMATESGAQPTAHQQLVGQLPSASGAEAGQHPTLSDAVTGQLAQIVNLSSQLGDAGHLKHQDQKPANGENQSHICNSLLGILRLALNWSM